MRRRDADESVSADDDPDGGDECGRVRGDALRNGRAVSFADRHDPE
jgi:hypothetical protein